MDEGIVKQRGSALVMAIVVLSLITTVGIALLFLADSDGRITQANVRDKRAFFVAEAGLEDAREQLRVTNRISVDPMKLTEELTTAAGGSGPIDFSPAALKATYDSNEQVTGFTGFGNDVPLRGLTSFGGGWYAAFLSNDLVDGEASTTDTNRRAMITAIGAGPRRSIKIVQAIVEKISLPAPPATLTLIGPAATSPAKIFDDGSSAAKSFVGDDCSGASGYTGIPGFHVPAVGTFGATATAQAVAGADSGSYASGLETGVLTVHDVSGTANPLWQDCAFLKELADKIKENADAVCTPSNPCASSYWAATNPRSITFVEGDLNLAQGQGVIWVTGTLNVGGNDSFEGILAAIGTGRLIRSGGGSGHSYGAIVVANIAGPDGVYGNADDCTGGAGGFAPPSYSISGGGSHDHVYCSQAIDLSLSGLPFEVRQFRQF